MGNITIPMAICWSSARLPDPLSDDEISDVSDAPPAPAAGAAAQPPMAVPSVQGFAQWNLERCPEVLEAWEMYHRFSRVVYIFSVCMYCTHTQIYIYIYIHTYIIIKGSFVVKLRVTDGFQNKDHCDQLAPAEHNHHRDQA